MVLHDIMPQVFSLAGVVTHATSAGQLQLVAERVGDSSVGLDTSLLGVRSSIEDVK